MTSIFLSYRRSDEPGYVGRLADSLESAFGEVVYRDVDSVRAGTDWKKSITQAVVRAEVVIAVIGPAWQQLLLSWPSQERDWVRHELNQARGLDVPIIPVRLANVVFDHKQDLGDLSWLHDLQFFELADGQGRWEADIERLVDEILRLTPLRRIAADSGAADSGLQVTHGNQSPNIKSQGPVNISYTDKGKS